MLVFDEMSWYKVICCIVFLKIRCQLQKRNNNLSEQRNTEETLFMDTSLMQTLSHLCTSKNIFKVGKNIYFILSPVNQVIRLRYITTKCISYIFKQGKKYILLFLSVCKIIRFNKH